MTLRSAHFLPGSNRLLGDKYRLLEALGDGSHGWVWRAERLRDGAIVALKIPKQLSRDDRSLAEGRDLIGVGEHPNVVRIMDMGRVPPEREWYAIEMEYFPSESLAQKIEQRSHHFGNTYDRLFAIYAQVLDAVAFLAGLAKPVSHGDIKRHNILIGQHDQVKLTDFGSSALPQEIYVRTRENGGTVLYSAPEFADCISRKGSFESLLAGDIYTLGVLLYQLTTGKLPHESQSGVRRHAAFPSPRELDPGICPAMEQVILHCLRREPAQRYASIQQLQAAFNEARGQQKGWRPEPAVVAARSTHGPDQSDWLAAVEQALARQNHELATNIAKQEYWLSCDTQALRQQLQALFRARRWFAFMDCFEQAAALPELEGTDGAAMRLLGIKVLLKLQRLDQVAALLAITEQHAEQTLEHRLCSATLLGLRGDYGPAREHLEAINRDAPREVEVVRRLVQVCEQQRDFGAAAGYLRVLLKLLPDDDPLRDKRRVYEALGSW